MYDRIKDGDSAQLDFTHQESSWIKVNELLSPFGISLTQPGTAASLGELPLKVTDERWKPEAGSPDKWAKLRQLDFYGGPPGNRKLHVDEPNNAGQYALTELGLQLTEAVRDVIDGDDDKLAFGDPPISGQAYLVSLANISDADVGSFANGWAAFLYHNKIQGRSETDMLLVAHEVLHYMCELTDQGQFLADPTPAESYWRLLMFGKAGQGPFTTVQEWIHGGDRRAGQ